MAKYRMCGGLAMTPDRDMKMLKEMSLKGWHLSEMKSILYRFKEGQPHDYDYALNLEPRINSEMMLLYEASGWMPVVASNGYQIFRAEAGTSPIFSDLDSEIEMLTKNRHSVGKGAAFFAVLLILCFALSYFTLWKIFVIPALFILIFFIFCFFPFIGYSRSLKKKQAQRKF